MSGTGKSTVAELPADRLGWELQEGDDLHPAANVAKMAAGVPLTDEDRWPWLDLIGGWLDRTLTAGRSGIVTCSALRRRYRDRLRHPGVIFVHLTGPREVIAARMSTRPGHFMPTSLPDSQVATLEVPGPDDAVITVDVSGQPDVDVVVCSLDALLAASAR